MRICRKKPHEVGVDHRGDLQVVQQRISDLGRERAGPHLRRRSDYAGYRNFFYRQKERRIAQDSTEDAGWWATPETKRALFGKYQKALSEGLYKNLSKQSLMECLNYALDPFGGIAHSESIATSDASGARDNHSDMAVADARRTAG